MPVYEIRLRGHVGAEWAEWLGDLEVAHEENGETVLSGPLPDQAALFGLLTRIRDLGLPLLAVVEVPASAVARGRAGGGAAGGAAGKPA